MLGRSMEPAMDASLSNDEDIEAKIAEAQEFLEALESGDLHIGALFEGRTDAKMHDLRRQIAMYQSILAKRHVPRP
jgi:hypothetical protein